MNVLMPTDARAQMLRDRVLLVLALVLSAVLVVRAAQKDDSVLERNVEFGARFLRGDDPYQDPARGRRVHGPYPPSYALVTAPLSLLPVPAARVVWATVQVGALAACWFLVRRWMERAWPSLAPHASVVYAAALLLASRYVLRDMAGGGGNLMYVTAAAWGIEIALTTQHESVRQKSLRRTLLAGLLLALPLVLKPNLAPLLLALASLRCFGAAFATVVVACVLAWIPALVFGFAGYAHLWTRWIADVRAFGGARDLADPTLVPDGFPLADTSMNQSLRESLWRFLDPDVAAWTTRVVSIALLAVACAAAARARGPKSRLLGALAFLPVCVLVSPISWKAHHGALLPLFAVLGACALSPRRRWLAVVLVVYYVACVLLSEELVGKTAKEFLQEISVVTFGALALFVATIALSAQERSTPDT